MSISPGVRAGIAAGISAGLAFAILVLGGSGGEVRVKQVSDEAAPPLTQTTETTAEAIPPPEETTTTAPPTTATTVRQLSVEERLARIEAATTTTTIPSLTPPSVAMQQSILVEGGILVPILYMNGHERLAESMQLFPNARIRLGFTQDGLEQEFVIPIPAEGEGKVTYLVPVAEPTPEMTMKLRIIATEWDSTAYGGSLATGAGHPWTGN